MRRLGTRLLAVTLTGLLALCSAAKAASPFNAGMQQQISTTEYNALVALYNSTNGPSWTNRAGWLDPAAPQWHGVTVVGVQYDGSGNVSQTGWVALISLTNNGLVGTMPTQLSQLSKLEHLELARNQLSGNIPPAFGQLQNLQRLYFYDCKLTGGLPAELGQLTKLITLNVINNRLTGGFPALNFQSGGECIVAGNFLSIEDAASQTNIANLRSKGVTVDTANQLPLEVQFSRFSEISMTANPSPARIGSTVTLSANTFGISAPSFQWFFNAAPINGATNSTFTINNLTPAQEGRYWVVITHSTGSIVSETVFLAIPTRNAVLNVSTRMQVQTGDNVLIGGFIVTGTETEKVVLRALGPSLGQAGVAGALQDTTLALHDGTGAVIASNDDWRTSEAEVSATGIPPTNNRESAIVAMLAPGAYTAVVRGKNDTTGVGLIEAYDLDSAVASKLANISTRGPVEAGDKVMIAGFIVGGTKSSQVTVRALGPSLAASGVTGVLADPTLELFGANGERFAINDNWKDSQQAELVASGIAPSNDAEAAIIAALPPGPCTAVVRGNNGQTGVALVEAYNTKSPAEDADAGSSYRNSKVPFSVGREALAKFTDHLGYATAIGYGDFNADGRTDVVFAPISGTTAGAPIIIALKLPDGGYEDGTSKVVSGPVPAPVHPRKIVVGDFNRDGKPDIYIADHGYDHPPFPGNRDSLLLSDSTGHLVYDANSTATQRVGFHHSAAGGDVDGDGDLDIFVTDSFGEPYFLINNGSGQFAADTTRLPADLGHMPLYTSELIDIDRDGFLDLLLSGHEHQAFPSQILWGDGSGFFNRTNATLLPPVAGWGVAIELDAEDLDNDGRRDLVITRTKGDPFYEGYYLQILMQKNPRSFTDESLPRLIKNNSTWIGNTAQWIEWIRLVDSNGDGFLDIVCDDLNRRLGWRNDGTGHFSFSPP
jgi:hypothetical protein